MRLVGALQRAMWWFLSLHFGFRARDKSRKLCWGDVIVSEDPKTGNEMLVELASRGGHQEVAKPRMLTSADV